MKKTRAQLEFMIKDCYEAISAYPQGYKTPEYFNLAKACEKELNRREGVRINRRIVREERRDPIAFKRIGRWRRPTTDYSKKLFDSACWSLGYSRLHKSD